MSALESVITLPTAARIVGVSNARMRQFVYEGRVPARKDGSAHLLLRSDVDKFAKQARNTGRPPFPRETTAAKDAQ